MIITGKISIVLDCGATNVRAVAIDESGRILSSKSISNNTRPDPEFPEYKIWDIDEIWNKMCVATRAVLENLPQEKVIGVTVTTFGVDGTLFTESGNSIYPMISWQCDRTKAIKDGIDKYISVEDLYNESATLPFNFNTIFKLIWFRENRPELLEQADKFLFAPSVFLYLLSGKMKNDITMAGTSMLTSAGKRSFSEKILSATGLPPYLFGSLAEPGETIGYVTAVASKTTGLPEGLPVVATGHDTQFAIYGSGASENQPVLSSGTWEVLMVRTKSFRAGEQELLKSITSEFDPIPGIFNIGNQWLASGILEDIKRRYFSKTSYDELIREAEEVPEGFDGLRVNPDIFDLGLTGALEEISKLEGNFKPSVIYRSVLEALALRLQRGLKAVEEAGGFRAKSLICTGGGSRNYLWNRLKARSIGIPVKVLDQSEATVLGASLFVQSACGTATSPEEARSRINYKSEIIYPL